jgi:Protein of unknown function (DUF3592)
MRLNGSKIRLVIGYAAVATGTCFLLLAVGFAICEASFLLRSSEAQGTVIANLESRSDADSQSGTAAQQTFCPQFRYESVDGTTHTVTSSACASPPTFAVGEKVRIHYLSSHPESGQIDSFGAKWGFVLGFGIASGALLPIGISFLNRLRAQGSSLDPISFWD